MPSFLYLYPQENFPFPRKEDQGVLQKQNLPINPLPIVGHYIHLRFILFHLHHIVKYLQLILLLFIHLVQNTPLYCQMLHTTFGLYPLPITDTISSSNTTQTLPIQMVSQKAFNEIIQLYKKLENIPRAFSNCTFCKQLQCP